MDASIDLIASALLVLACAFAAAYYFIFVVPKKRFERLPGPPLKSYLLGHLREVTADRTNMPQTLLNMSLAHGPTLRVFFPLHTFFLVTHPDDVRFVTSTRNYPKAPGYVTNIGDLAPGTLLTADAEDHALQRSAIAQHFNPKRLPALAGHVRREVRVLIAALDAAATAQRRVDLDGLLVRCLLDAIARVTLGEPLGAQADAHNPVVQAFHASVEEVYRNMIWAPFRRPFPGTQRKLRASLARLHGFVDGAIARRRPGRGPAAEAGVTEAADAGRPRSLLDAFLALPGATPERVRGSVTIFLFAGHDTTAHTLSFLVLEACRDARVQARLAREVDAVMGDLTGADAAPPDAGRVDALAYCAQAWQEALRLYPSAAAGTIRRADRADVLPHSRFPLSPGVGLFVMPYVAHRHPMYWDEPLTFRPERFAPQEAARRRKQAPPLFPFSNGPRNCIGAFLARFEALYIIAALFGRYRVALDCDPERVKQHITLTLRPRVDLEGGTFMGLPVKLSRRRFREYDA